MNVNGDPKINVHLFGSYYSELLVTGYLKQHDANPTDIKSIITLYYGRISKRFRFHINDKSLYYPKNCENKHSNHVVLLLKPELLSLISWNRLQQTNENNITAESANCANFIEITLHSSDCQKTDCEIQCGVIGIPKTKKHEEKKAIKIEDIIKLIMDKNNGLESIFDLDKSLQLEAYWLFFVSYSLKDLHYYQCMLSELNNIDRDEKNNKHM